ncbi:MAG: PAS domain-containing hybrid sensor histidine kinase/response regulator [Sphaerochaeta sp.]
MSNSKVKKAIKFAKSTINSFLIERDADAVLSSITEDITSVGFRNYKSCSNKEEFKELLEKDLKSRPLPYAFEYGDTITKPITDDLFQVILELKDISNPNLLRETNINCSFLITEIDGIYLIKSLIFSLMSQYSDDEINNKQIKFGGESVLKLNDDLKIVSQTDELLYLLGFKDEETFIKQTGGCLINLIRPEEKTYVLDEISNQLKNKNNFKVNHDIQCFDKTYIKVEHNGSIMKLIDGVYEIRSFIIKDDVKRSVVEVFKRKNLRLQNIIESYPAPIFFKDLEGKYQGINRAFLDFYKLDSFLNVLGRVDFELFEKDDAIKHVEEDKKVIESKETITRIYSKDSRNTSLYYKAVKIPLIEDGKIAGVIGYLSDVSEIMHLNEEIKNSELEIEYMFKYSNIAWFTFDNTLHFKRVNELFLKLFKLKEEDVINKHYSDFNKLYKNDKDRCENLEEILRTGKSYNYKDTIEREDGNIIYISVKMNIIYNSKGEKTGIVGTVEDISKEKLIEQQRIDIYNQETDPIFNEKTLAYTKIDIDVERIVLFEDILKKRKFTNVPLSNFLNSNLSEVVFDYDKKLLQEKFDINNLKIMFEQKNNTPFSVTFSDESGGFKISKQTIHFAINPFNSHREVIIFSQNITEEIENKNLVNTVMSSEYDFILQVNGKIGTCSLIMHNGHVHDFNFTKMQRSRDIIAASKVIFENSDYDEYQIKKLLTHSRYKLKTNNEYRFFFDLNNGKRKNLTIKEVDEEKESYFILCNDITLITKHDIEMKNKLSKSIKEAKLANQIKSDFLASMRHDMRTPLNGIIGLANFGIEESKDSTLKDYFSKIRVSSYFLYTLLNDVLDMQSIEQGKLKTVSHTVNLKDKIDEIDTIVRPRAREKNINFTIESLNPYPEYIYTDSIRFNQVLINILSNAIKYTPKGGDVKMIIDYIKARQSYFKIEIKDNGVGMSENFQKHMFEKFTTEKNPYSALEGGSGLGLSISKYLTEMLGGKIECESELNKGTTITLNMPFQVISKEKYQQQQVGTKILNTDDLKGKRVLVCEDNYLNTIIVEKLLAKAGIICDVAENGKIGVEMEKENEYDAILMDIRMPVLGGIEATRIIRKRNLNIPIIALSANAYKEDIEESLKCGMNAHLSKPIDIKQLFSTLRILIH